VLRRRHEVHVGFAVAADGRHHRMPRVVC
jgi:hypothetical protein